MITTQEKINNLETILKQQKLPSETKQLLLREIERLKKELERGNEYV